MMYKYYRENRIPSIFLTAFLLIFILLSMLSPMNANADINQIRNPELEPILFDFYMSTAGSPTNYNYEGFNSFMGCTATVQDSCLNLSISYGDPQFKSVDNMNMDAAIYKYIKIRMKNSTAGQSATIYFITTADTAWNEAKSKTFAIRANDPYFTEYIVDMSTVGGWTGRIRQLRIDPENGAASGTSSIDRIGIYTEAVPSDIEYGFDSLTGGTDGFNSFGGCTASVSNSFLNLTFSYNDPRFFSVDNINLDAAAFKYIKIKMRNSTSAQTASIYFITTADTAWNEAKCKTFAINPNDTECTEYIADMSTLAGWTGAIKQIRFDPQNGAASGTASIDLIGFYTGSILPDVSYGFTGGSEGWTTAANCSVSASGGIFTVTNTGANPQISSPNNININASQYKYIKIKMKNNTSCNFGQIY